MKSLLLAIFIIFISTVSAQWVSRGPSGGDVLCFMKKGDSLYAGTGNGVYVSTDWGKQWKIANNGIAHNRINALAFIDNTLYAATAGGGVYVSVNGGGDWVQMKDGLVNYAVYVTALAVQGNSIFAGTSAGIFIASKGDASWTFIPKGFDIPTFINGRSFDIVAGKVFAATNFGVYSFNFSDSTWEKKLTGVPTVNAITSSGGTLFIGTRGSNSGVLVSTDTGKNWTMKLQAAVNVLASYGDKVFAGTSQGVYVSDDWGDHWMQAGNGAPLYETYALVALDTNVLAGSGSGVSLSTDAGGNWQQANNGLAGIEVLSLLAQGSGLYAGGYGIGMFFSENEGSALGQYNTGLTNTLMYDATEKGDTVFIATNGGGVFYTTDGKNWTVSANGLENKKVYSITACNSYLYAGTNTGRVYISDNNGELWQPLDSSLPALPIFDILAMGDTIAVTAGAKVYFSVNRGKNWIVPQTSVGFSTGSVRALAAKGNVIYAGTDSGVFVTTNLGSNWDWLKTGMENKRVRALAVRGNTLFAGTVGGVYISSNDGALWASISSGLPQGNSTVYSISASNTTLYAGTNSGVWSRPVSEVTAISEAAKQDVGISLYPNPAHDEVFVQIFSEGTHPLTLEIVTMLGQTVYSSDEGKISGEGNYRINTHNLDNGIYLINVLLSGAVHTKKLLINR